MSKKGYYFNPRTLSFEKEKVSIKQMVKRLLWFFATGIAFAVLVLWIAFYLFDSPKEKMLLRENNELKQNLQNVNDRLELMDIVLEDLQTRDQEVYRTIFEVEPMPFEQRHPTLLLSGRYKHFNNSDVSTMVNEIQQKSMVLSLRLLAQSKSLDTIADLATKQAEMLLAIPAIRPLKNMHTITSGFGNRYHPILKTLRPHTGIDITAPKGTPVYATADGVVTHEAGGSGYGITVEISHGYSYKTLYAHLSKKIVKPGQRVKRGEIIGYVGSTGLSLGSHLHYEVIKNGKYVNPVHYFYSDITPEEYESILESSKEINQALS